MGATSKSEWLFASRWIAYVGLALLVALTAVGAVALGTTLEGTVATVCVSLAVAFALAGRGDWTRPWTALPAVWYSALALTQLPVLDYRSNWSSLTFALLLTGPLLIALFAYLFGRGVRDRPFVGVFPGGLSESRLRTAAAVLLLSGFAGLAIRVAIVGEAPILSQNIDESRLGSPVPAPVTLLSDGFQLALWAAMASIALCRKRGQPASPASWLIAGVALMGAAAPGSRNTLLTALVVPVIFAYLVGARMRGRWLGAVVLALLLTLVASGLFFLRTSQHDRYGFEANFYSSVVPATPEPLRPLLPVYVTATVPFETYARVVRLVPTAFPHGHGAFSAAWVPSQLGLLPERDFYDITEAASAPYYFVVATYQGRLFADFGAVGVLIGSCLIGLGLGLARKLLYRKATITNAALWALVTYTTLFLVYENIVSIFLISLVYDAVLLAAVSTWAQARERPQAS